MNWTDENSSMNILLNLNWQRVLWNLLSNLENLQCRCKWIINFHFHKDTLIINIYIKCIKRNEFQMEITEEQIENVKKMFQ